MKNNEIINQIFITVLPDIVKDIGEKYKTELISAYKDYLIKKYQKSNFQYLLSRGIEVEKIINMYIDLENNRWSKLSCNIKLSRLLNDESFDKIKEISGQGYDYAVIKLKNNFVLKLIDDMAISVQDAENRINEMNELLLKVREFNLEFAKNYVSDGTLDYDFACGKVQYMSLRVGREKERINMMIDIKNEQSINIVN